MSKGRAYDIAFVGLKPGMHEYTYSIDDKFFESFQEQDFSDCHAEIKLSLNKQNGFMLLKFEVGGNVMVTCDRCNNDLKLELWDEFLVTIKMVEEPELMNDQEEDPDVYYISRGESHINVENWIYEFINLSIPMHKTCNAFGGQCNETALKVLGELDVENSEKEDINPIWKGLEKFKNKDN